MSLLQRLFAKSCLLSRWSLSSLLLPVMLAVTALTLPAGEAEAAKGRFGTDEQLNHIQDIDLKGPEGEALFLGYKTSTHSFIVPYSMTNDGYILGTKGANRYYTLDSELIQKLQGQRQLPSPMPPYEIDWLAWSIGHMAWILLGGLALLMAWGVHKKGRVKKSDEANASAMEHANEGRHAEAIAGFTDAIKLAPKNVMAYHNRALAFSNAGQPDKAISDHTTVIRLAPKSADAFMMRAFANQNNGEHDRAITDFGSALRFEPDNIAAYLGRSVSFRHKAAWQQALADCNKVIELAPQAQGAFTNRAETYEAQGAAELAAADRAMASSLAAQAQAQAQAQPGNPAQPAQGLRI